MFISRLLHGALRVSTSVLVIKYVCSLVCIFVSVKLNTSFSLLEHRGLSVQELAVSHH